MHRAFGCADGEHAGGLAEQCRAGVARHGPAVVEHKLVNDDGRSARRELLNQPVAKHHEGDAFEVGVGRLSIGVGDGAVDVTANRVNHRGEQHHILFASIGKDHAGLRRIHDPFTGIECLCLGDLGRIFIAFRANDGRAIDFGGKRARFDVVELGSRVGVAGNGRAWFQRHAQQPHRQWRGRHLLELVAHQHCAEGVLAGSLRCRGGFRGGAGCWSAFVSDIDQLVVQRLGSRVLSQNGSCRCERQDE